MPATLVWRVWNIRFFERGMELVHEDMVYPHCSEINGIILSFLADSAALIVWH